VKLGQERHWLFETAAQAVDVPGHHNIELPLGGVATERIEGRPSITRFSAADAVIPVTLATCQPARSAIWRSSSSWLDVV
jgi:hypothetical protein